MYIIIQFMYKYFSLIAIIYILYYIIYKNEIVLLYNKTFFYNFQVKQTRLDKEQIAEEIADKLGYAPGVSYSEIAKRAADCGRKQLAIKVN